MSFKYCPRCGDEFQQWAETCPDCDVPLGHEPPSREAAPVLELPPAIELTAILQCTPSQVRAAVASLEAAEVPFRIDKYPPGEPTDAGDVVGGFGQHAKVGVYVRAEDLESVVAIPEWRERLVDADRALEACPACGHPISADSEACADCGLEFPELLFCAQCGNTIEPGDPRCGHCGTAVV